MEKTLIGLTGEYYTLARLSANGFVAALTLGNAKSVDILVANQDLHKLYKVEVKTTSRKPAKESLFGKTPFYIYAMSEKHETIAEHNLIYVFVVLEKPNDNPRFFVVPSKTVAKYVKWQHEHWIKTRKKAVQQTKMRNFRIPIDDPFGYENNWDIFKK